MTSRDISHEALLDKLECQDLVYRFCHALDGGRFADAADMFADNGQLVSPAGDVIDGPAVRESLLRRPTEVLTRHLINNLVITLEKPDHGQGLAYVTNYNVSDGAETPGPRALPATPRGIGEWLLEFERTTEGGRISRMEAVTTLTAQS